MSIDSVSTQIRLTFSCKNLKSRDFASKSDPYLQLLYRDPITSKWQLVGRTETKDNEDNPDFVQDILVTYKFEEEQVFKVVVMDSDHSRTDDDFVGESAPFKLGNIMSSRGQKLGTGLLNSHSVPISNSIVLIRGEVIENEPLGTLNFTLSGRNFDAKDGPFFKSDPFYEILVADSVNDEFVVIFKSEIVQQNLNPKWQPAIIPLRKLGKNKVIKLMVTDYDADGTNDLIGSALLSLDDFVKRKMNIELVHPPTKKKYQSSTYKNSGYVDILDSRIDRQYSMTDFIKGGLKMSLMIAIDFTGSNGNPSVPGTNHYGAGQYMNSYLEAINSIGRIVLDYDDDKLIPTFGFGARPSSNHPNVSHCFPLNPHQESLYGIDSVMASYTQCFQQGLIMSGPTYFAEVIHRATELAQSTRNTYAILLLLTDGAVNDLQNTIDAIVAASQTPLSIIIVGVGQADFSSMEALDADVQPLVSSRGVACKRDLVQFVPFNQVAHTGIPSAIANETLKELPNQLSQYFHQKGIKPNQPIQITDEEIIVMPAASVVPPPSAPHLAEVGRNIFNQAF